MITAVGPERPAVEVAEVIREHGDEFTAKYLHVSMRRLQQLPALLEGLTVARPVQVRVPCDATATEGSA